MQHERVAVEVEEVAQAAPAPDHQREQHEHHRRHAEVGAGQGAGEFPAQHRPQLKEAEVTPHELEPLYDLRPVRSKRSARFPLTRPRKSALLHRPGNGLASRLTGC